MTDNTILFSSIVQFSPISISYYKTIIAGVMAQWVRVLSEQTGGPQFGFPISTSKAGVAVHTCNPSLVGEGGGDHWDLLARNLGRKTASSRFSEKPSP